MAVCRLLAVAATHEQALETARQSMAFTADWLGEFGFFEAWRLPGQEGPVPWTVEQVVAAGGMLVGTPDEVGEQVQQLRADLGVEYVVFVACGGAIEHARMLEMIELFGQQVIPAVAEPGRAPLGRSERSWTWTIGRGLPARACAPSNERWPRSTSWWPR